MKLIDEREIYSVSEVGEILGEVVLGLPVFWIEGEVSDLRPRKTQHGDLYGRFELKDEGAALPCVLWPDEYRMCKDQVEDGKRIIAKGKFDFYAKRGSMTFVVQEVQVFGEGELLAYIEKLKRKLEREGLFDLKRKRVLPRFPSVIGLITSEESDAYHDFIRFVSERYPFVTILFAPSRVQGVGAAKEMMYQLKRLNKEKVDFIVLTRGGGSLEDLMEFNDEGLAYAIAGSRVPVVSAVGHEADVTIADFVADLRAATPTDAGKIVVPDRKELENTIQISLRRATIRLEDLVQKEKLLLENTILQSTKKLNSLVPLMGDVLEGLVKRMTVASLGAIRGETTRLSFLGKQLAQSFLLYISQKKQKLHLLGKTVEAVSPKQTLRRGYAVVSTDRFRVVTSSTQVAIGEKVDMTLYKGKVTSIVHTKEEA
ncbi:MAG TPA: exodeoxyribonuclease VII large subunit [Patescibacteria group bacterium]|nr:exodeoxyribonuclease VII large subunit [Patescibacteria group bacterium]